MAFKVLILAGTTEGRLLGERLHNDPRYDTLLSFAGRTASLRLPASAHRVGGFGGVTGLVDFLRAGAFDALIDATHPFAAQMSRHAVEACAQTHTPLLRFERAAWQATPEDKWQVVPDMPAAARALGKSPRRVFLSVGRLELAAFRDAAQHDYLVRMIDAFDPELASARVIAARGPFTLQAELELLERERIELVVSKNSGTDATFAKLLAARSLQLPVIMVQRPVLPPAPGAHSLSEVETWLARVHGASLSQRGE